MHVLGYRADNEFNVQCLSAQICSSLCVYLFVYFKCIHIYFVTWFAVFKCHGLLCVMCYATDCHGERHDLLCLPPWFIKLNVLVCYVLHHGLLS